MLLFHFHPGFGKMMLGSISLFMLVSLACGMFGSPAEGSEESSVAETVAALRGATASTEAATSPAVISPTGAPSATLQPTDTPLPPTPTPLVIQDKPFGVDYDGDCDTDIRITGVVGENLEATGTFSMRGGQFTIWCYGAKHTWLGTLVYGGYTFASDDQEPLQFTIQQAVGYVYTGGKGVVTLPDGSTFAPVGAGPSAVAPVPNQVDAAAFGPLPPSGEFQCASPRLNDFSKVGRFDEDSADFARWGRDSGGYFIEMKQPDSWVWQSDAIAENIASFEADVSLVQKGPGAYGLVFGAVDLNNGNELYAFMLDQDGRYGLFKYGADGRIALRDFTETGTLLPGEQGNRIRVVRSGSLIGLYANGTPLTSVLSDDSYPGSGYAGLMAASDKQAGLKALFDNYSICRSKVPLSVPLFLSKDVQREWPANQPVELVYLWQTVTQAQGADFIAQAEIQLKIDGVAYPDMQAYWRQPRPVRESTLTEYNLPLPPIPPGKHVIDFSLSLSNKVSDGYDSNKDGQLDSFGPGEFKHTVIELDVPGEPAVAPAGTLLPQASPKPAATAAPTNSVGGASGNVLPASKQPFQVGEITLQIDQVEYGKPYAGLFAPANMTADQTVLTVVVDVLPGMDATAVSKMGPWVSDPAGVSYPLGTGLSHNEPKSQVVWLFAVPKDARQFFLNFPGGVTLDLASLMP